MFLSFADYEGLEQLAIQLDAEGIPNSGVSFIPPSSDGTLPTVSGRFGILSVDIHFLPSATRPQKERALVLIKDLNLNIERKTPTERKMDISSLSDPQKDLMLQALINQALEKDSNFALNAGVSLDGNKPKPKLSGGKQNK